MMLVDCESCPVRDVHCGECMVTALMSLPVPRWRAPAAGADDASRMPLRPSGGPGTVPLDRAERRAVSVLIGAGLLNHDEANRLRAVVSAERPAGPVLARDVHARGSRAVG